VKSKEIVTHYINALNNEDFANARLLVTDDFKFDGVLGQRDGADVYFVDMKKMKLKYSVHKVFENGNDVCVLCDITMDGSKIFNCLWYTLEGEKIKKLKALFDPTPIYEKQKH
jgi:hypothetical protein